MSNTEKKTINECIALLKQEGANTKAIVYEKLQDLISVHNAKWGE